MYYRLLDTGIRNAVENIALDAVLLEARTKGDIPNTLRFLQFSPPAVLVGFHQTIEQEIRVEFCKQRGIDINRRITGGGAIYFDESQLGWELIASKTDLGYRLDRVTERVCEAVTRGLKILGVEAKFRPRNDIEVHGRKISGTGGVFEDNAVLFQGTLLIDFDVDMMLRALRIPTEKLADKEIASAGERVTCLRQEMGKLPSLETIKQALQKGFEEVLGIRFEKMLKIPEKLRQEFAEKKVEFLSKAWIEGIREPLDLRQTLNATYKTKAGLIRASCVVDVKRRMLKQALVTGDFFISPVRTIFDLEAELKDIPLNEVGSRVESFFRCKKPQMSVTSADFVTCLSIALEKVEYPESGISLEEANYLFTVNGTLCDILKQPQILLLPYCAKLVGCEYRYHEGCNMCGGCSVGTAYELADQQGLKPITIQNYKHLWATLQECKANGVKSYIGCCCEAFFAKRQRIFREAGIPGLLIDIENSTCYDLDREAKGLAGEFENQTKLRLGLLEKMINHANRM